MPMSPCPHCGGSELYRSLLPGAGNSMLHSLLPRLHGALSAVVCRDCGLTRFFALDMDTRDLDRNEAWERVNG